MGFNNGLYTNDQYFDQTFRQHCLNEIQRLLRKKQSFDFRLTDFENRKALLLDFFEQQYEYEVQREPMHPSFKENYIDKYGKSYEVSNFINYYFTYTIKKLDIDAKLAVVSQPWHDELIIGCRITHNVKYENGSTIKFMSQEDYKNPKGFITVHMLHDRDLFGGDFTSAEPNSYFDNKGNPIK